MEGDRTDGCGEVTAGSVSGLRMGADFATKLTHAHCATAKRVSLWARTTALASDLRPMIEGKLTEGSQDPRHIQVLLREAENGTHVSLQDKTGVSWVGFTSRCLMENGTHVSL